MYKAKFLGMALLILAVATDVSGQGFRVYPAATRFTPPDTERTREAMKALPPDTEASYYLTNDAFEKVVAFYKDIGKEYTMPYPKKGAKLPNGQELKEAYFIFDGAKDIVSSKSWAKVQRPYIGWVEFKPGSVPQYQDVRDVTAIVASQKK